MNLLTLCKLLILERLGFESVVFIRWTLDALAGVLWSELLLELDFSSSTEI